MEAALVAVSGKGRTLTKAEILSMIDEIGLKTQMQTLNYHPTQLNWVLIHRGITTIYQPPNIRSRGTRAIPTNLRL